MLGVAAFALTYLVAPTTAADEPLPWDGRGVGLTVETLKDKYLTHILTMRNGAENGKPSDYVTITQDARPSYNEDTAVIQIGVDGDAMFQKQTNFRRSELVQNIANNAEGVTFFRISVMKEEAFLNPYAWQIIFPESHLFEIRVDATAKPPKIIYLTGGTYDAKWETEFVPGTWYNFGIGIKAGSGSGCTLEFYVSEGSEDLALEKTEDVSSALPTSHEFHFGALTLSDDGSAPKMAAKQDILSYNGVSVTAEVSTAGGGASGGAGKKSSSTPTAATPSSEAGSSSSTPTAAAPTADAGTPPSTPTADPPATPPSNAGSSSTTPTAEPPATPTADPPATPTADPPATPAAEAETPSMTKEEPASGGMETMPTKGSCARRR